ncbi:SusC/RagA family TonB-linked outer membrane protein [Myroides odoratimimus]|uniref:SusC/RagA family TonB-linked outer membrane protein n=2 Tax=Myroides odoratimimus TaxID=76832 RepID=UPI00103F11D4|nr:SusC/RagA family TonB-linked outer membrane protein [Myroides odoratimimus]MCA4791755.1 SusC/RagA family TonB-linked outer membrane protein [Myroides odoratimimus]MCA4805700.1 SusC/RagA family TonB-linked outer membrane protein [Myroides odoratimimus]MCA4819016.1 SusC/RagA family TonB-linked outer membrane protein [Myroides odoratimimus]MDM1059123.1 SusC/RagA family TonB-linked outer membrane protein [Myroides odoratimimus]MDM1091789.1 SusC/RagA family TonB-linked outer membrane protein [My
MKKFRLNWFYASLLLLSVSVGHAQNKTLTGKVSDGGTPLPGVSVTIKGTQHGTQTDLDGKYSLNVKQGDVLVFSFIGMQEVTYEVGAHTMYNVNLLAEDNQLAEVIVTAYGENKARNEVTGNVVSVKGDVISSVPVASVDQALQGRVAGLQMAATSGSPGAMQDIRIRGRNSLSANNEPLFVVDGVPLTSGDISGSKTEVGNSSTSISSISGINSEDIESISVLKDAGATAAYGARGGNGVILITTKRGKKGKPSFDFKATVGFQDFAVKGPKFLNGEQKKELWLEAIYNTDGKANGFTKDGTYDWYVQTREGSQSQLKNWVDNGSVNNDWRNAVLNKHAFMSSVALSVTGGDDKGTYFASVGHEKYDGVVIGTDFRKVTGSFNMSRNLSDRFDIKIGANVSNIKQNAILEGGAYFSNPNLTGMFMSPWVAIYNEDGSLNTNIGGLHNSLYTVKNDFTENDISRVISNNSLGFKITDDLKFESTLGLDYILANYKEYKNPNHGDGVGVNGYAQNAVNQRFNYVWQNSFNYKFYLGDGHRFNTRAIMEFQKNKSNLLNGYGEVIPPGMTGLGTAAANFHTSAEYIDWSQLGFLGLMNYSYENRYLLDLTLRREGSSRFSNDNRWGTFYAIGGAWNLSSESFLKDIKNINLLRLRGSYGTTGNSEIEANRYVQLVGTGYYNNESALVSTQFGGTLGWEKQTKVDFGIEFGLFNNRISGSVAYFESKSKDLLYRRPLSLTSGFEFQWMNMGDLKNSGFEFEINFDVIRKDNFNWSIGANLGTVKNEMVNMPIVDGKPLEVLGSFKGTVNGKALETWRLREFAGVDSQTGLAQWYKEDGTKTTSYNQAEIRFQNTSALPKFTGGVNTRLEYKGAYIDALFSFAGGYSVYDYWAGYTNGVNSRTLNTYNGTTELLDRWQKPGDVTDVPKLTKGGGGSYTSASTRFLYKGDHIRLKQLTVGYSLNKKDVKFIGVDAVNLSLTARNPLTWVKDSRLKWDPEVKADGYIEMATPPLKTFIFTLNVKF